MFSIIFRTLTALAVFSGTLLLGSGFAALATLLSGSVVVFAAIMVPVVVSGSVFAMIAGDL